MGVALYVGTLLLYCRLQMEELLSSLASHRQDITRLLIRWIWWLGEGSWPGIHDTSSTLLNDLLIKFQSFTVFKSFFWSAGFSSYLDILWSPHSSFLFLFFKCCPKTVHGLRKVIWFIFFSGSTIMVDLPSGVGTSAGFHWVSFPNSIKSDHR